MKILLVGNYAPDRQWSMDRFCNMLLRGLQEEGVEVEPLKPSPIFGGRNKWLGYLDKFLWFRFTLPRETKGRPGCLVHILDQGNAAYPLGTRDCLFTCHDLIAVRASRREFPSQRTGWTGRILQRMILRNLRKSKAIACVSRATQQDAERLIGPSELIPNGLEDYWRPMDPEEAWTRIENEQVAARDTGFLLHVGGSQWYKNRSGVVRGYLDLRAQTLHPPKLVLVGPDLDAPLLAEIKEATLDQDITVLKSVPDETLRALYSVARAFIFPSLAEGFGWPILEAQACGCPVVTTDREPMRQTAGEAAIYADPETWTEAAINVLEMDQTQRSALVAAGRANAKQHSVKRMVGSYIEFYRSHAR